MVLTRWQVFSANATHAETAPLSEGAVRSHSTACDDGTFMFPKESRRALSACRLRGVSAATLRVTYGSAISSEGVTKKKSQKALFFWNIVFVPFRDIPLNQLQSLCDRNPRGITFGYASRDHCFVIASEGVTKKEPKGSFFVTPTQLWRLALVTCRSRRG